MEVALEVVEDEAAAEVMVWEAEVLLVEAVMETEGKGNRQPSS